MSFRFRLKAAVLCLALGIAGIAIAAPASSSVEKSKARTTAQKTKAKSVAAKSSAQSKTTVQSRHGTVSHASSAPKSTLSAANNKAVSKASVASPAKKARAVAGGDSWRESQALAVQSASALVFDQSAGDALFSKNADVVSPIASITKLMTAMVVLDSAPNLKESISIAEDDVDMLKGSRSRLHVGTVLPRETALLLALMSSENRAAHALARHYPGGLGAFITAMNAKAQALGMMHSKFLDPTGLNSNNVSTAHDLARMVSAAYRYPLIRELSTTSEATVEVGGRDMAFRNTNPLVKSPTWDVGLSKTGYIQEAGKCLVMQARVAEKPVVIVLLDSAGKLTRVGDANRIKRWMEHAQASTKAATHASTSRGVSG